jgi:solute:Na+ symporter, SSS family
MTFYGLHWADLLMIVLYLGAMVYIGQRTARTVKKQTDLYLGGRKLGKALQFFLNFGNMTDLNNTVTTSSAVYGNGAGGAWISLQTLFMTPYYWFMNVWFRRVRLVTMADLFEDRFGGRSLATLYSIFNIVFAVATIGWGYMVTYKTIAPLVVKEAAAYTPAETQMLADYADYRSLGRAAQAAALPPAQRARYDRLKEGVVRGELFSYVSWLKPLPFYSVCALVVAIYCVLGGLTAAVIVDIIQGLLIMVFSIMLIPFGLARIGGFSGLHARVPDYFFDVFGSVSAGAYTWFSFLAILFTSVIQINAVIHNMTVGGSARNEMAARVGAVSGGYSKRLMIIAWSMCGLIAVALFGRGLPDPDNVWGLLSERLLFPGLIGLMLVGILAANMSALSARSLVISALFSRNLYEPVRPRRSEAHYVLVGRITIVAVLGIGVAAAMLMHSVVEVAKLMITSYVVFGAPVMLIFLWRRLTRTATLIAVIVSALVICVVPYTVPSLPALRRLPALTVLTRPQMLPVVGRATADDVQAGLAASVGQKISKQVRLEPVPAFFEAVVHADPRDPASPLEGRGYFSVENWLISLAGVDVRSFTPAGLLAARFWFDGIFPFVLLIPLSFLTRRDDPARVARFYVKMKTPVAATPEEDDRELAVSYADPTRFDDGKLFPGTSWELTKWTRADTVGFLICSAVSFAIFGVFWGILQIGK